jgi:hypothetical protein
LTGSKDGSDPVRTNFENGQDDSTEDSSEPEARDSGTLTSWQLVRAIAARAALSAMRTREPDRGRRNNELRVLSSRILDTDSIRRRAGGDRIITS